MRGIQPKFPDLAAASTWHTVTTGNMRREKKSITERTTGRYVYRERVESRDRADTRRSRVGQSTVYLQRKGQDNATGWSLGCSLTGLHGENSRGPWKDRSV